jgi:hypothetical protein
LHENTGATGVYIGELEHPFRRIQEDAEEHEHLDTMKDQVLKFKWAKGDHADAVIGTDLPPTQGIAHDALTDELTTANQNLDSVSGDLTNYYKHIYVKEVVREPKMHFWKVPRLGAFMAIPLVYKSCLNETHFQQAHDDFNKHMDDMSALE